MANNETLANFTRALGHIRTKLRPLARVGRDEVSECLSRHEAAKLNVSLAYGLSSLFYMYLKTQGVAPDAHPVRTDLRRIQDYVKRLNAVEGKVERRKLVVDREASRRFIEHALAGDPVFDAAKGLAQAAAAGECGASSAEAAVLRNAAEDAAAAADEAAAGNGEGAAQGEEVELGSEKQTPKQNGSKRALSEKPRPGSAGKRRRK